MKKITVLADAVEDQESLGDRSSSRYEDLNEKLKEYWDLLNHNAKQVKGKWVPKEYQKGSTKEKAELIGKHFRKLLDGYLRDNCRSLYEHLIDKNTLFYGINNCYRPKPAIRWEFDFKGGKKGT